MEKMLDEIREGLIEDIERRLRDKAIEKENATTLIRLIKNTSSIADAQFIHILGTKYAKTGFHYDCRRETIDRDNIYYFKKNEKLSFPAKDSNSLTHKLVIGENYKALLNLLIEYKGRIDVIYIDPPYGKDAMGDFAKTNYENAISRDNLLSMLEPRLRLAQELLSETGVIFCSIDDRNQAYVKCLFDDVFGERNYENFVWKKKGGAGNTEKIIGCLTEYILCYFKNKQPGIFNYQQYVRKYKYKDEISEYNLEGIEKTNLGSYKRPTMLFPIVDPATGTEFTPSKDMRWTIGLEGIKESIQEHKLFFDYKKGKVYYIKRPQDYEESTNVYYNLLLDCGSLSSAKDELDSIINNREAFGTPKPIQLIMQLMEIASKKDSIILDFFAGSGTTGQAVMELNRIDGGTRQFILCTDNEITDTTPNGIVIDVTSKRLKRVMTGKCYDGSTEFKWLKENVPYGDGLDVYDIDSVFAKNDSIIKNAFEVIDETLYGKEKLGIKDKIEWVCSNFENTQLECESDKNWQERQLKQSEDKLK